VEVEAVEGFDPFRMLVVQLLTRTKGPEHVALVHRFEIVLDPHRHLVVRRALGLVVGVSAQAGRAYRGRASHRTHQQLAARNSVLRQGRVVGRLFVAHISSFRNRVVSPRIEKLRVGKATMPSR
jgi:hypothetical protein